jgi:hypothetical protein
VGEDDCCCMFPAECRFGCGVVVGTGVEKCSCSANAACVSESIVCQGCNNCVNMALWDTQVLEAWHTCRVDVATPEWETTMTVRRTCQPASCILVMYVVC